MKPRGRKAGDQKWAVGKIVKRDKQEFKTIHRNLNCDQTPISDEPTAPPPFFLSSTPQPQHRASPSTDPFNALTLNPR